MKKIIFLLALTANLAFTAKAQQLEILSNNVDCDLYVIVHAGAYQSNPIIALANTSPAVMTSFPGSFWQGGIVPGTPWDFDYVEVFRDLTCSAGSWTNTTFCGAICGSNANQQDYVYMPFLPPSSGMPGRTDCFEFSDNCGLCSQGDHVRVFTTADGLGLVTVNIQGI